MRHYVMSLLALALTVPAAHAAMLGDASVPFRAERTVTVDGRSYSGRVFHVPGHQRHDQDLLGMHEVFLLDTKAAQGIVILPSVRTCLLYTSPSPRDRQKSRMPSSA